MQRLYPSELLSFQQRYRFVGARLRRVRLTAAGDDWTAELSLLVRPRAKQLGNDAPPVRLKIRLTGLEEYRLQKRPNSVVGKISDARIGYFGDSYFLNLDAWGLEPGEVPKLHDYRNSDLYLAARELWWEEVPPKKKPTA